MSEHSMRDDQKTDLNRFLESVGSNCPNLIYNPGRVKVIHHYTDLNGLRGIVGDHDLWLTQSRFSNDSDEMTFGFGIVREVIDEASAETKSSEYREFLRYVLRIVEIHPAEGVYVCCFCEKDNLLSQWRSYSANGAGVSIGFDPTGFSYITGSDSSGLVRLWKVFYKRKIQKSLVRDALAFAYQGRAGRPLEVISRQAAESIQFFIPTFKNPDFEEEQEIRLIFTPFSSSAVRPRFRVSRGLLIPYYSLLELDRNTSKCPLPIVTVRIGPNVNNRLNFESTRMLLRQGGFADVSVNCSDTPYRG